MKREEEYDEKKFKVRSYGKSELAALYLPDISPKSAADTMKKWIEKAPGLTESLAATGVKPMDKKYTPAQVRLIVEALGEP